VGLSQIEYCTAADFVNPTTGPADVALIADEGISTCIDRCAETHSQRRARSGLREYRELARFTGWQIGPAIQSQVFIF
jgi:hypothetical protein